MRARNVLTPILVLTAVVSACSNPSGEVARDVDPNFAAELDLALFAGAEGEESSLAVVSDLELARPGGDGASPSVAPARREPVPAAPTARSVALLGEPLPLAEAVDAPPAPAGSMVLVGLPDVAEEGGADHGDHAGTEARTPGRSVGPIIIRGGVSGSDPCKLHIPGRGGLDPRGVIGVLINDKVPYGIGRGNSTYPGRGRSSTPRLAGGFPGGIR
jgi:hypothetical protein